MSDMLKGKNGRTSSKRVMSVISVSVGIVLAVGLSIAGIFIEFKETDLIKSCLMILMSAGTGISVSTLFEKKDKE